MHRQIELAYLGIEVPDPTALTPFFGDVIGLMPGGSSGEASATWRNDDRAHSILVEQGPANGATSFHSPLMAGGFLTEGVGFSHVLFATPFETRERDNAGASAAVGLLIHLRDRFAADAQQPEGTPS